MWISIASTLINVLLDYLLIFWKFGLPRLETAGAALAAVCLGVLLLILEEKINVEDAYKFRDLRAG